VDDAVRLAIGDKLPAVKDEQAIDNGEQCVHHVLDPNNGNAACANLFDQCD
jgi:hypothetical protein